MGVERSLVTGRTSAWGWKEVLGKEREMEKQRRKQRKSNQDEVAMEAISFKLQVVLESEGCVVWLMGKGVLAYIDFRRKSLV